MTIPCFPWVSRSVQGLSGSDIAEVQRVMEEQVQANMGMAMLYPVVCAAQEWLLDKVQTASTQCGQRPSLLNPIEIPISYFV
jgi:glucokinase